MGALISGLLCIVPLGTAEAASPPPPVVEPGEVRAPERSVPTWVGATATDARVGPGSGKRDLRMRIATPRGSRLVFGDWEGDGLYTPAVVSADLTWTLYAGVTGNAPAVLRQFRYGRSGDVPVAGDWNGDGRTDIGVSRLEGRRMVWYQRDSATRGRSTRAFGFGGRFDVPLAGDWNGDGRDTPGVRRGVWFRIRNHNSAGPAHRSFRFGSSTDLPVVGDWDGDGRDGVGAVRQDRWYLLERVDAAAAGWVDVPRRSTGDRPVPWRTSAGPRGDSCPTAGHVAGRGAAAASHVVASGRLGRGLPPDAAVEGTAAWTVLQALRSAVRYQLGSGYASTYGPRVGHRYVDFAQGTGPLELGIRLPAMAAVAVATSLTQSAYDAEDAGVAADTARDFAVWVARSLACNHRSNTPQGWGDSWQAAHWTMFIGQTGWLLWDVMDPQERAYVAGMVEHEANRLLTQQPLYWIGADGIVRFPGDTKAEENSWNAAHLMLAALMMPGHPHADRWRARAVDFGVASFATPSDLSNQTVVNGVPVAQRINGYNAAEDGTLENHGVGQINPDYMSTVAQNLWTAGFSALADRPVPRGMLHNADRVYGAFRQIQFDSPPWNAPGGTIYGAGGAIYFPAINSWGAVRRSHWVDVDSYAVLLSLTDTAGADLLAHAQSGRALQLRFADGRSYPSDPTAAASEDRYPGREEYAAQMYALSWSALYVGHWAPPEVSDEPLMAGAPRVNARAASPDAERPPAVRDPAAPEATTPLSP